uniref:tRNA-specific adenosine deaminase n=1 Tax=Candidatus Aschnera chinzeii TaxID=1485666 RepID=A0AAT9G4S7_9ENTR|nr:MAG: tRNA adenosine(34) deaminase TadA [Candidatus Aschnera chinzeii]
MEFNSKLNNKNLFINDMKYNFNDYYWMKKAIILAKRAQQNGEIPVGALLINDKKIIATGWNANILLHDPSAHAEILVLRTAGRQLKNYRLLNTTIYVTLEPCIMCAGALINARINRLVYGAYNPNIGAAGSTINIFNKYYNNHKINITGGVLAKKCSNMLNNFFKKKR